MVLFVEVVGYDFLYQWVVQLCWVGVQCVWGQLQGMFDVGVQCMGWVMGEGFGGEGELYEWCVIWCGLLVGFDEVGQVYLLVGFFQGFVDCCFGQ